MRFDTSQQMRMGQQMKLAPRMIQSMEILQMPLAELRERIEQELESNPTMDLAEASPDESDAPPEGDEPRVSDGEMDIDESGEHDFARLDEYTSANPEAADNVFERSFKGEEHAGRLSMNGDADAKFEAMAQAPARAEALSDTLHAQWSLVETDDTTRALGEVLIDALDDDGYLRTDLDAVADAAPQRVKALAPSAADWETALTEIQLTLDPVGVGARDARECLLIQIDAHLDRDEDPHAERLFDTGTLHAARRLVAEFFDELMHNRLPRIASKSRLTLDEINDAVALLRRLSLAPARRERADDRAGIVPDAVVEYDDDEDRYVAHLTSGRLPDVKINQEYARMVRQSDLGGSDREFLKKNLSNAQWLIDAIGQRRHTLLRVVNAVVDEQRDYFDYGPESLRPLPMKTIADRLGIHVATVSRAVSEKYLMTPRGIVPLRSFFSGGLATEGGEDVSANAVRAMIRELVDSEDKAKPMSDEAMVKDLTARGVEIARRTVAKYRDQLGIPTARMRKRFAG